MHRKEFNIYNKALILSFICVILFVYILLFEFIIPANRYLPKPSILFDTIPVLFLEYDFLSSFLFSFTAIYALMIVSNFFIRLGHGLLFSIAEFLPGLRTIFIFGRYLMPLFLILLFNQWFDNIWGEYIFILIILMGSLKAGLLKTFYQFPDEYIESAKSLGLNRKEIISKVVFKYVQPQIIKVYLRDHILLWGWVIIYEYLNMNIGIGSIFKIAIEYNDLSLIILLILITLLIIAIMDLALNRIKKSYYFWK